LNLRQETEALAALQLRLVTACHLGTYDGVQ